MEKISANQAAISDSVSNEELLQTVQKQPQKMIIYSSSTILRPSIKKVVKAVTLSQLNQVIQQKRNTKEFG